jgi:hypothetical protein
MSERKSCRVLLDEAFHTMRALPGGAWLAYVCCGMPFVVFCALEWQRLTAKTVADELWGHAALLALLYLLMGAGRSVFCKELRSAIHEEKRGGDPARTISANHMVLHMAELALLPCALVSIAGFPWTLAFFRFALCGQETGLRRMVSQGARRASALHRQAWLLALILAAVVLATFLNVMAGLLLFPDLFKALSGYETPFTRSHLWILNSSTVILAAGVTLLLAEALALAVMSLAVFYENAETNGRDLLLQLKKTREAGKYVTALLWLLLIFGVSERMTLQAEAISATKLDQQVDQVLREHKYDWVAAANRPAASEKRADGFGSAIARVVERGVEEIRRGLRAINDWIKRLFDRRTSTESPQAPAGTPGVSMWLLGGLGLLAAGVSGFLLIRGFGSRVPVAMATPSGATPAVDLHNEELLATALPEDEWLQLAGKHFGQGESRLAVRALYLAGLAALAKRELLSISAFKTNADYKAELRRRARSEPVVAAFSRNGFRFESTWYGLHEVSEELVAGFQQDLRSLREITHV